MRASNDPGDLGTYVAVPVSGTDLGTLIDPTARYIQYRVAMDTSDGDTSPVLREVVFEDGESAAVGEEPAPSLALTLSGASPNPMLEITSVAYRLAEAARVRAAVYDASGREVVQLEDSIQGAGSYELSWNGLDASGHATAAGTYFIRLRAGAEEAVRRVVRIR